MLHLSNKKSVPDIVKKLQIPENDFSVTFQPLTDWKPRNYLDCSYPFTFYYRKLDYYTLGCVIDGIIFERAQMGLKFYLLYRYKRLQFKVAVEDIICIEYHKQDCDGANFVLTLPTYCKSKHFCSWCEDNEAKFTLNFICRTLLNNPGKAAML